MSRSATTKAIDSLQTQLKDEKTAHARTRNELQAVIDQVWRLVPGGYISLMGVYPPLRRLLHVLGEAAELQDPSKGAPVEDTMRTQFVHVGNNASTSATELGLTSHERDRENVRTLSKHLQWVIDDIMPILENHADRMSRLIPGTETEYHPPDGECEECGRLLFQNDTGRKRSFCSTKCRVRSSRKERV